MKYMGSKRRFQKYIVPIVESFSWFSDTFIDACCGGANLIEGITKFSNRVGYDIDPQTIQALQFIQTCTPESFYPIVTEEYYKYIVKRYRGKQPITNYEAWSLFEMSYGGKICGGYRRDKEGVRDYFQEGKRNALRQSPKIKGCEFKRNDLLSLDVEKAVIYVDPPYKGTTKYSSTINHDSMWDKLANLSKENVVLVSEYEAPAPWTPIWEKETVSSLTKDTGSKKAIEKLWVVK